MAVTKPRFVWAIGARDQCVTFAEDVAEKYDADVRCFRVFPTRTRAERPVTHLVFFPDARSTITETLPSAHQVVMQCRPGQRLNTAIYAPKVRPEIAMERGYEYADALCRAGVVFQTITLVAQGMRLETTGFSRGLSSFANIVRFPEGTPMYQRRLRAHLEKLRYDLPFLGTAHIHGELLGED